MSAESSSTMASKSSRRSISAAERTPLDDINPRHAQIGAQPGEYWLISKDGEQDWPVVICDEEVVQTCFRGPRPENARKADGTWPELFQPGGELLGQVCFPVLYLGTYKLRWASWKRLKSLDLQLAVAMRDTTPDKNLRDAYNDAIGKYGWTNLDYWKDKLCAIKLAECTAPVENKTGKRKRRSTPNKSDSDFKWPPGFGPGYDDKHVDDDEEELLLAAGEGKRRKIKKEVLDTATLEEINALYEVSDEDDTLATPKRGKPAVPGRSSSLVVPPAATTPKRLDPVSVSPGKSKASDSPIDMTKVQIYVGNPHSEFTIKRSGLDASSPLLSRLVNFHPNVGPYVMSPLLSSLSATDFESVAQYLDHGEYYPNLLTVGSEHVCLEDIDYERGEDVYRNRQRVREITRCGTIYAIAQQLELPGLQSLAFRKLKALGPYPAKEFLFLVGKVDFSTGNIGDEPESDGPRAFIVNYLAKHFCELIRKETKKMLEIIEDEGELARDVFRKLAGVEDLVAAAVVSGPKSAGKEEDEEAGKGRREEGTEVGGKVNKAKGEKTREQTRSGRGRERLKEQKKASHMGDEGDTSFCIYEEA